MAESVAVNKFEVTLSPEMIKNSPYVHFEGVIKELHDILREREVVCEVNVQKGTISVNSPKISLPSGYQARILPSGDPNFYLGRIDASKLPLSTIELYKKTAVIPVTVFITMGNILFENHFGRSPVDPFSEGRSRIEFDIPFSYKSATKELLPARVDVMGSKPEGIAQKGRYSENSRICVDYGTSDNGKVGMFNAEFWSFSYSPEDLRTFERICALV